MTQPLLGEGEDVTAMFSVPSVKDGDDVTAMFSVPSVKDGDDVTAMFSVPSAEDGEDVTSQFNASAAPPAKPDTSFSSAIMQGIDAPLEAIGITAQVLGAQTIGKAIRGMTEAPVNYESASEQFSNPKEGDFTVPSPFGDFAPAQIPRAITEQFGQLTGSLISRVAGGIIGGAIGGGGGAAAGSVTGPGAAVTGGIGLGTGTVVGQFAGPFLFGALQIVGPTALERAKRNGRTDPNGEDIAASLVTAAGSGSLDALGAQYLPGGKKLVGSFVKRLAGAFYGESVTEAMQSVAEQTGESLGTKEGLKVSLKQAFGEGIIGGISGSGATAISEPFRPADTTLVKTAPSTAAAVARTQPVTVTVPKVAPQTTPKRERTSAEIAYDEMAGISGTLPSGSLGPPDPIVVEAEAAGAPQTAAALNQTMPPKPFAPRIEEPGTPTPYGRETDVFDITTGLQRKPAPAAKAAARDASKPEQMTPDEWDSSDIITHGTDTAVNSAEIAIGSYFSPANRGDFGIGRRGKGAQGGGAPRMVVARGPVVSATGGFDRKSTGPIQVLAEIPNDVFNSIPKTREETTGERVHHALTKMALERSDPVSSAAVDAYGIKLPEGYVRRGELYVFDKPPKPTPTAPAAPVPAPVAKAMTRSEINERIAVLLKAPAKAGGKPRVSFNTQAEEASFRRGFEAANKKPGEPPPEQRPGVPAKEQKIYDAFSQGWSQAQIAIRSLSQPTIAPAPAAQAPAASAAPEVAPPAAPEPAPVAASQPEKSGKAKTDKIEAALDKAIDALKPSKGTLYADPLFIQTVGRPALRAALMVARAAYRAGKTVAEAVADGIAHLKTLVKNLDEAKAREFFFAAGLDDGNPLPGELVEGGREGEYYTRVAERDQGTLSDNAMRVVRNRTTLPDSFKEDVDFAAEMLADDGDLAKSLRRTKSMASGLTEFFSGLTDRRKAALLFLIAQNAATQRETATDPKQIAALKDMEAEAIADFSDLMSQGGKLLNIAGQLYAAMPMSPDAQVMAAEKLLARMTGGKAAEAEAQNFLASLSTAMQKELAEAMLGQPWSVVNQLEMVRVIAKLAAEGYAGKLNFEFKVTPPSKGTRQIVLPGLAGMRESLASMLAKGLERNWWQALAGPRAPVGPLTAGVNSTQNQLAGILRQVMEARKLVNKEQAAKLTDAEKVAMFIGKKQLTEESVAKLDESVSEEIEKRATEAIEAADDANKPAVKAQWAAIRDAWEEATSSMKNRPASNATMRRMIHAEAKESEVDWDAEMDAANDSALAQRLAAALVERVKAETSGEKLPGFPALDLEALRAAALEQAQTVVAANRIKYTERLLKRAIREQEAADSKAARKYLSEEAAVERKAKALDAAAVRVMDKLQNSKQPKTESEKSQITKMHDAIREWLKNPIGEQDLVEALVGIGLSEARASNVVSLVGRERSYMDREIAAIEVLRQAGKAESEAEAIIRAHSPIIAKLNLPDAVRKAVRDLFTEQFRANPERDQATFERDMTALGVPAEAATRLYQIANTHRGIREAAQYQRATGKGAQRQAMSAEMKAAEESIRNILMNKGRQTWDQVRDNLINGALNRIPFATIADRDAAADAMIADFKARMEKAKTSALKALDRGTPKERQKAKTINEKLFKLFELGALDDAAASRVFMEKAGVQEFTPAFRDKLKKMYEDAEKAPEGMPRERILGNIAVELALANPKTFGFWWNLAMSISYGNILGAFTTIFVNNPLGSLATSLEMVAMGSLSNKGARAETFKGAVKTWARSLGDGVAMMRDLWSTGENLQKISQFDSALVNSPVELLAKMAEDPSYPKAFRAAAKAVSQYKWIMRSMMAADAVIRWPAREALRFTQSAAIAKDTRRPGQSLEDAVDELNYPGGRPAAVREARAQAAQERKDGTLKTKLDERLRVIQLLQSKLLSEAGTEAATESDELANYGSLLNDQPQDFIGVIASAILKIAFPSNTKSDLQKALGGAAQPFVRFVRTSANATRVMLDYAVGYGAFRYMTRNWPVIGAESLAGGVNLIQPGGRENMSKEAAIRAGDRLAQVRIQRAYLGIALYAGLAAIYAAIDDDDEDPYIDFIGSGPTTPDERRRLRDTKRMRFNSIKIGDIYVPTNVGPLQPLAGILAPFQRMRDNKKWPKAKDEFDEKVPEMAGVAVARGIADAIMNQSFTRSLADLLTMLNTGKTSFGETPTEFIGKNVAQFIPGNLRGLSQLDEIVSGKKERADGFFDTAANSIAFYAPNGRAVTILGDEVDAGKPVVQRVGEKVFQFTTMTDDKTALFVARNGLSIPDRQRKADGKRQTYREYSAYMRESGKMMRNWLETKNSKTGKTGMEMLQSIPEEVPGEKGKPINLRKKEMNKLWSEFRQVALLKQ